jgi:hypothetical protein
VSGGVYFKGMHLIGMYLASAYELSTKGVTRSLELGMRRLSAGVAMFNRTHIIGLVSCQLSAAVHRLKGSC